MAEYVDLIHCSHCNKPLKSSKPIPIDTVVKCPVCGEQFRVEADRPKATPGPAASHRPDAPATAGAAHQATTPYHGPGLIGAPPLPWSGSGWGAHPSSSPPSWSNRPSLPGAPEVPGYVILAELGRGGMGVVYKARHERLKRVVALKMIQIDPQDVPFFLPQFQAEAEAVARLHHPNIVQIFEVGEQGGRPYLALEFVPGGTLKARLDGQPQPIRASAELVEELARAAHVAHLRGIVHRDLKPANILLEAPAHGDDRDGAPEDRLVASQLFGVPKITDFGVAKRMDDDFDTTGHGRPVGTPLYMAPEQAKGQGDDVGPATDVYALGVILYEMLAGRPPFLAKTVDEALSQVTTAAPPPLRPLRKQVPRDLEAICLRCLEKDPRHRYRSALALADDLRRFLDGEPIRARHAGIPARLWSWCLRNPVPASLLLTGTVVLAVGQWSLFRLSESMVEKTALETASQQTEVLREMNKLYTDVAAQAKKAGVEVTHKFPDDEKTTIPIPARFTILLGERVERQADEDSSGGRSFMRLQMYSNYPFRERAGSPPKHRFGIDALKHYATTQDKDQPFYRFDKYNGLKVLRYATPLIMVERCIGCHNDKVKYPHLTKTDWKPGDVRGVLEIICPLDDCLDETRRTLFGTYSVLGILGAATLATSWITFAVSKRRRRL